MNNKKFQHYFLLAVLLGVTVLSIFILRPFIYVIILALICVTVFHSIHQKILRLLFDKRGLAALFTTILIIITILIPVIFLGVNIFWEAQRFYFFLIDGNGKAFFGAVSDNLSSIFYKYFSFEQPFSIDIAKYVEQGLLLLLSYFSNIFSSIIKLIFDFLIFVIITYYMLKDGAKLKSSITDLIPMEGEDKEIIIKKIKIAINSVIRGSLVVALVQGILVAIGFALFGVPNVILWGIVATIASLVPGVGTAIIALPAIVYVFFTGSFFSTIGLLVWSFVVVGLSDTFLRPILIGNETKIHPLFVFLSVIGGIILLGPIGFLLGPLIISLFVALFDVYSSLRDKHLKVI